MRFAFFSESYAVMSIIKSGKNGTDFALLQIYALLCRLHNDSTFTMQHWQLDPLSNLETLSALDRTQQKIPRRMNLKLRCHLGELTLA